jgi:hypothetical protein
MKKIALQLIIISVFFISCEKETVKFSKLSSNQNLGRGEWLDSSDTLNGISIRENKIAFFKKMQFNSHQVFQYHIVDSIYKKGENEKKVGEFLFVEKNSDTLIYRIVKRDKKAILLQDSKQIMKVYNFWR